MYKYNDLVKCIDITEANHEKLTIGKVYKVICHNIFDGNVVYTLGDDADRLYHSIDRFEPYELSNPCKDILQPLCLPNTEPTGEVSKFDIVDKPSHYNQYRVEVIDIIEDATTGLDGLSAVCLGNVLKYVLRFKYKNGIQDLKKARWYLDRMIKFLEDKES